MHYNFKLYTVLVTESNIQRAGNYVRCSGYILGTFDSRTKADLIIAEYKRKNDPDNRYNLHFDIRELDINKPTKLYVTSYVE